MQELNSRAHCTSAWHMLQVFVHAISHTYSVAWVSLAEWLRPWSTKLSPNRARGSSDSLFANIVLVPALRMIQRARMSLKFVSLNHIRA